MVNQTKTIVKLALFIMLFSLHVEAFDAFIEGAYKQNSKLSKLEKEYQLIEHETDKDKLENALVYGYDKKMSLHVDILEKKKKIILGAIARYFTVLAHKRIYLLYDENNQNQTDKYNKSLKNFKTYTGLDFKKTNLEKLISSAILPKNSDSAYEEFLKLSIEEQTAIIKLLKADSSKKVFLYLRSSYKQYINMLNDLKVATDNTNETKKKSAKEKYIKQVYKVLFKKCKILLVTGTLKSDLAKSSSTQDTKLKRIHFGKNSSEVSSYSINIVKRHAKKLLKLKNFTLELHGYSDNLGDKKDRYNLSKERTENTKEALVKLGVNPDKIKLFYYGEKNPIKTNKTKQGRLLNRRVEFKLRTKK